MKEMSKVPTEKERRSLTYKIRLFLAKCVIFVFKNRLLAWAERVADRDERMNVSTDRVGNGRGTIVRFQDTLYQNLDDFDKEEVLMKEFWKYFKPEAQNLMKN